MERRYRGGEGGLPPRTPEGSPEGVSQPTHSESSSGCICGCPPRRGGDSSSSKAVIYLLFLVRVKLMIHQCEDGIVYIFSTTYNTDVKGTAWIESFDGIHDNRCINIYLSSHNHKDEDELIKDIINTIVHEQLHHQGIWGLNCDMLLIDKP